MKPDDLFKDGDKYHKSFNSVVEWHNFWICFPSWEEIFEYEYVRQSGQFNMFDKAIICEWAIINDFVHLPSWFARLDQTRCSVINYYSIAMGFYEKTKGPSYKWFPLEVKKSLELKMLKAKKSRLTASLNEINRQLESEQYILSML